MKKRPLAFLLMLFFLFAGGRAAAFNLTESWYMHRGKSNMEIGNYKAAIEAFEKVVEKNPDNKEALRDLGLSYDAQGLKDKSVEAFDRYLNKYHDDPEISFKQAQNLEWSRYSYRRDDVGKYYKMGLARKDDTRMRLRYARYLAQRKETSPEAVTQFEKVLKREPRNPEAHRGLAKAYAWLGDNDQALYHSQLAEKYAGQGEGMKDLERDLSKGREPTLEGSLGFLFQSGGNFDLKGFQLAGKVKGDLTPFMTNTFQAGYENYFNSTDSASGGFLIATTEYRFEPTEKGEVDLGYHGLARNGSGLVGKIQYTHEGESGYLSPGFRRNLRYDSLMALAGTTAFGPVLGTARDNDFYLDSGFSWGSVNFELTPFVGWVSTATLPPNDREGMDATVKFPVTEKESFTLTGEYLLDVVHYGSDQSGFGPSTTAPLPGGYFSPDLFLNQTPRLAVVYHPGDRSEIEGAAGPSIQYIEDYATGSGFKVGTDVGGSYTLQIKKKLMLKTQLHFVQITDVYSRFDLQGFLVYTF